MAPASRSAPISNLDPEACVGAKRGMRKASLGASPRQQTSRVAPNSMNIPAARGGGGPFNFCSCWLSSRGRPALFAMMQAPLPPDGKAPIYMAAAAPPGMEAHGEEQTTGLGASPPCTNRNEGGLSRSTMYGIPLKIGTYFAWGIPSYYSRPTPRTPPSTLRQFTAVD